MSSQVKRGGKVWKAVVGVISTVIIVGLFVALLVLTASVVGSTPSRRIRRPSRTR